MLINILIVIKILLLKQQNITKINRNRRYGLCFKVQQINKFITNHLSLFVHSHERLLLYILHYIAQYFCCITSLRRKVTSKCTVVFTLKSHCRTHSKLTQICLCIRIRRPYFVHTWSPRKRVRYGRVYFLSAPLALRTFFSCRCKRGMRLTSPWSIFMKETRANKCPRVGMLG